MIGSFRQSMTWLHTWGGLIFCWILYFMFITGTLGYFDTEIDRWMSPEQIPPQDVSFEQRVELGVQRLEEIGEGAESWFIIPGGTRERTHLRVSFQGPVPDDPEVERASGTEELNAVTGQPLPEVERETGGGQLLYRMHYLLHYFDRDIAYRAVGLITLLMFVGIVSGIIVHKRIFKDFFTFRPRKGQRTWLDMHNILSVSSLPFQIMITYSGLIFVVTLWMLLIPIGSFGFDVERGTEALEHVFDSHNEPAGTPAELADVMAIVRNAEARWGADSIGTVSIDYPGDANARISVNSRVGVNALTDSLIYDGVSGELVEEKDGSTNAPIGFAGVMIGLHEGLFAGPILRWLYFFSGLAGAAMIATGAIHWTSKRRKKALTDKQQKRGFRFVECLNIGTIVGLPIGIAAYFLANRLLPLGFDGRAEWEVHCMFIAWGACLLYPVFRPTRLAAWRELFWLGAIAFAAIPLINALTTDIHLLNTLRDGDWVLASFDLTALFFAVVSATFALRVGARVPEESTADDMDSAGEVAVS